MRASTFVTDILFNRRFNYYEKRVTFYQTFLPIYTKGEF